MSEFERLAPAIMQKLLADFPIEVEDAAAVVGNLAHECGGFESLQEKNPVVAGSRGGYGWPQWTGPRRREYEAYCKRNNLDPAGEKANYAFLFVELKGSERRAIPATVKAKGLDKKVEAFCNTFLRPGIAHMDSRKRWARKALALWPVGVDAPEAEVEVEAEAEAAPVPAGNPVEKMVGAAKGATQGTAIGATLATAVVALLEFYNALPPGVSGAAFGAALTGLFTAVGGIMMAALRTYQAPPNG